MNKEQVKGRYEEAKGAVKEAAGKIVGNERLEHKGKVQKNAGKFQAVTGDINNEVKKEI